jgi:glycosyltransferase involved in cell wall biosynthesis
VVGSAGRLFPVKGYELMVEAAHETRKRSADVKFKLAGDGPERNKLLGLIKKYELEKIFSLTGFVEDMSGFYSDLDIYINTSFHEGLPMTIIEAMSHRVPVIATKIGGMGEIYQDGIHGYLVGSRNPAEFADRIIELYLDRELRIRMGEESRKKIENEFSASSMAEKYFILYKNL